VGVADGLDTSSSSLAGKSRSGRRARRTPSVRACRASLSPPGAWRQGGSFGRDRADSDAEGPGSGGDRWASGGRRRRLDGRGSGGCLEGGEAGADSGRSQPARRGAVRLRLTVRTVPPGKRDDGSTRICEDDTCSSKESTTTRTPGCVRARAVKKAFGPGRPAPSIVSRRFPAIGTTHAGCRDSRGGEHVCRAAPSPPRERRLMPTSSSGRRGTSARRRIREPAGWAM